MASTNLTAAMRQFKKLFKEAANDETGALAQLAANNDRIAKAVNKNLRELEKSGFNYGTAYNQITHYTDTQYETNRMKLSGGLDKYEMMEQIQQGVKFLSLKSSTVEGQRDILQNKISALKSRGIIPEEWKERSSKQFIKFLANEEARGIIEEYGTSDKVILMIRDALFNRKNTQAALQNAFLEYLSGTGENGKKTFDELMEGLGVDVYSDRYNREKAYKNSVEYG